MQAVIFGLTLPVIPLLLRRLYSKERGGILRYAIYTLIMAVISTVVMVFLCDGNTSFLLKADASPMFALKFLLVESAAAALVTVADWAHETGRVMIRLDAQSFRAHPVWHIGKKVAPFGIYVLALAVVGLNLRLIFDNVLWGDEAYAANLVKNNCSDILLIMHVEGESHPPLYYFWLRMWTELLGHTGPVLHFASFLVFLIGIVFTLLFLRKRYGKIPAAFSLAITGLSIICVEYNVEVRMYALAFLGATCCYYCAGRILKENRILSWIGMVLWGLVAAYSHYYGLLTAVFLMIIACLFAAYRFGKKTWIRIGIAALVFILGYMPWFQGVFDSFRGVVVDWWMNTPEPLRDCVTLVFGGKRMMKIILPMCAGLLLLFLLAESSVIKARREEKRFFVEVQAPSLRNWSAELYILVTGLLTMVCVIVTGYVISAVFRPVLARRYLYPLLGIVILMLVIETSHLIQFADALGSRWKKKWIVAAGKGLLLAVLAAVIWTGIGDYKAFYVESVYQSQKTEEVLALIGEPTEDMVLVNDRVQHIGWTVLRYYYPEAEVKNSIWSNITDDDYWYFTRNYMGMEEIQTLTDNGYTIAGYGEVQLAKYPFVLYHFYKE